MPAKIDRPPQIRYNNGRASTKHRNGDLEAFWREDGREVTEALGTKDWAVAAEKLKAVAAMVKSRTAIGTEVTFDIAFERMQQRDRNERKASVQTDLTRYNTIRHIIGEVVILKADTIWYNNLSDGLVNGSVKRKRATKGRRFLKKKLDKASARNVQRLLKRIRNSAVDLGLIFNKDVLPHWGKCFKANASRSAFFRQEHVTTLWAAAIAGRKQGDAYTPLQGALAVGFLTGARINDVLALKITDIEPDFSRINFKTQRRDRATNKEAGRPKIKADLLPILRELVAEAKRRGTLYLLAREDRQGDSVSYVVPTAATILGQFYDLLRCLKSEGVPQPAPDTSDDTGVVLHSMRHTYITLELDATGDLLGIAAAVGDKPSTVADTYAHIIERDADAPRGKPISLYGDRSALQVVTA